MTQFRVLFQKEWRENVRNYKILWIPLVFILFAILEPVTQYFLPQLLDSLGNLPDGAVIEFPEPSPGEILANIIGQYQFIGLLVLILAYMGAVAGERRSGTATLLYVRPLSYGAYYMSKWVAANLIAVGSVLFGLLAGYYYTALFFGQVEIGSFLQFAGTYCLWIILVVTVILTASAWMPNGGLAAAVSFVLLLFMQLVDGLLGAYWTVSPFKVPTYAAQWLWAGPETGAYWWSVAITVLLIVVIAAFGAWMSKKNAAKVKV